MMDDDADIAVVGIGCHFPGGEGLENFWQVLLHGKNCAVQIPNERFDLSQWYDSDDSKPGKTYTAKAALIDGLNEFDHKFFGITDAESTNMDPQHKLLLQCTYRSLEDAGIPMEKASGTRTGVFLGLMNKDFELGSVKINPKLINHSSATGLSMSIAANRISYSFNFTGPSLTIDCACSSSLVALHFACQAIRQVPCHKVTNERRNQKWAEISSARAGVTVTPAYFRELLGHGKSERTGFRCANLEKQGSDWTRRTKERYKKQEKKEEFVVVFRDVVEKSVSAWSVCGEDLAGLYCDTDEGGIIPLTEISAVYLGNLKSCVHRLVIQ